MTEVVAPILSLPVQLKTLGIASPDTDDFTEDQTLKPEEAKILRMKYGLVAPELTASEQYLIQKEERKNAGI